MLFVVKCLDCISAFGIRKGTRKDFNVCSVANEIVSVSFEPPLQELLHTLIV